MARAIKSGGWALLLLSVLCGPAAYAQSIPARLRGNTRPPAPANLPPPTPAPTAPAPAAPMAAAPVAASPQSLAPQQMQTAPSMLQQPAQPAQVILSDGSLSIHAENASLSAILRQVATASGMKIDGLNADERVFGSFGPGDPRDVLADLLNGTAYNVVLLGDLSDGAPRELILTPATHGAIAAAAPVPQMNQEEPEQESADVPPPPLPPEVQTPGTPAPANAVKTPQQLFEQLQRMRQQQQNQQQGQQQGQQPQQAPVQQDSPQP